MKIGYLVSQYPAPSHTFIRREIDALRRMGVDIRTYSIRTPRSEEIQSERDKRAVEDTFYVLPPKLSALVEAHVVGALKRPWRYGRTFFDALRHRGPGAKQVLWSVFYFGEAILLARGLERDEIEHLHNHFGNAGANVGFLASRYLGIGWSFTLHGISEFEAPFGELLGAKIAWARFAACVSHFTRAQAMLRSSAAHHGKLFINRCGLELSQLPRARRNVQERRRLRFVNVGRLSPEKGQVGLIDAFSRALATGLDAELIIVGGGPEGERIRRRISDHGLMERVMLTGRQPEARTLATVADADVFVLSSFMEGLPVSLMEAFASAVPVIAPRVAGIPELVVDGQSGLLFDAANWKQLAECMVKLGRDAELRAKMGALGLTRVQDEFDIEQAVLPLLGRFRPDLTKDRTAGPKAQRDDHKQTDHGRAER